MSSRKIRIVWKVEDTATDATSAVLSDTTGTYGVKRNDTDAVVVADGTAMTKVGTGTYEYSFDEPASGLSYTAYAEIVYEGQTYWIERDLAATGSTTSLDVSYTALKVLVADFLGWGRNTEGEGDDWSSEETARLEDIINTGARRVYYPQVLGQNGRTHKWSFLFPSEIMTFSAPYSTGTVTVASGVATLSGGTFPSWAAQGDLVVDGERYAVATRDSDTQATLVRTTLDADAGTSYSLERYVYDLPSDFHSLCGNRMAYHPDHAEGYRTITRTSVQRIRELRRNDGTETDYPQHLAIRPASFSTATGQRWEVLFHPTPEAASVVEYRYQVEPSLDTGSDVYFRGGPMLAAALEESCLAVAEQRYRDDGATTHTDLFRELLAAALEDDKLNGQAYLGPDEGGELSDPQSRASLIPTVTIDGVAM